MAVQAEKNLFKLHAVCQSSFLLLLLALSSLQECLLFHFWRSQCLQQSPGLGVLFVSSQWALLLFHNILPFNSQYLSASREYIGSNQIYESSYQYLPSCLVMGHKLWRRSDAAGWVFTQLPRHSHSQKVHNTKNHYQSKKKMSFWNHSSFTSSSSTNLALETFLFSLKKNWWQLGWEHR